MTLNDPGLIPPRLVTVDDSMLRRS